MGVLKITETDFENEVLKAEGKVVVDFYADWCGPCKMLGPVMEKISEELEGKVKFTKINIDENMSIAEKYEIMSIPTIIVFENGNAKNTIIGLRSKQEIIDTINE